MREKIDLLVRGSGCLALLLSLCFSGYVFPYREALAQQKPTVIRFTHNLPEDQSVARQARVFEKCVKEKSNGKVLVEVYPAAQLFTMRDALIAVRKGAVEMAAVTGGAMQGSIPLMEIFDLPFLFENYEQVKKAWNGEPGAIIKQELEKSGVKTLAEGYHSFIDVSNSKREIRTPKDIKGLKFRTIGPMTSDIVTLMGGAPIVMGGDEAYLALARKVVDGSFQGVYSMAYRKMWEVQKYATLLHLNYTGMPMLINLEFWKGLPNDIKSIIQECAKESEEYVMQDTIKEEKGAAKILAENGMKVYFPTPADIQEFRKMVIPIREVWVKKHGDVGAKMVKFVENIH